MSQDRSEGQRCTAVHGGKNNNNNKKKMKLSNELESGFWEHCSTSDEPSAGPLSRNTLKCFHCSTTVEKHAGGIESIFKIWLHLWIYKHVPYFNRVTQKSVININCQRFAEQVQMEEYPQWTVLKGTYPRLQSIDTETSRCIWSCSGVHGEGGYTAALYKVHSMQPLHT